MRRVVPGPGLDPNLSADWRRFDALDLGPILDAALEEFRLHGYHGSTVRDIAARVGVTVPTLYYHFGNKQGLLATLLTGSLHDLLARARFAWDEAGDDPRARFTNLVECVTLCVVHRRRLVFLDAELRGLEEANRARYVEQREELSTMMRTAVRGGVEAGVFRCRYPVEAAHAVLNMCQSVGFWYSPDGPLSIPELTARHVAIALDTVRQSPAEDGPDGGDPVVRSSAGRAG